MGLQGKDDADTRFSAYVDVLANVLGHADGPVRFMLPSWG